jgi:hypothetical protein
MLKQHQLPGYQTALYEAEGRLPSALKAVVDGRELGIPVACCVGDDSHWTLLGTRGMASSGLDRMVAVAFGDIRRISVSVSLDAYYAENPSREKSLTAEFLIIEDQIGNLNYCWFSTHIELFAFWNILRRLSRVSGG